MVIIDKLKSLFTVKSYSLNNLSSSKSWWKMMGFNSWGGYNEIHERKLINEGYLSNEDVYAVIDKLVHTSATIPICLYVKKGDKWEKVEDPKNDFFKLLTKPNQNQTLKEYRKEQYLNYLLTGDSFELKTSLIGFTYPTSLNILPTQFVEVELLNSNRFFSPIKEYVFTYGGYREVYEPEQVMHVKILDPSYPCTQKGLSPLQPSYMALSTSNQVHKAEESMIENRGATGMISSNKEDYPMTEEERNEIDKNFKSRIGGASNYNKMITISSNVKFTSLGANPKDLMLTEIDLNKLRKFCNIYGVSSQLFNDPANKTFNNLGEAKKSLYTESAIPLAQTFVDNWNENLVPIFNKRDRKEYYIELDISEIEVLQKDKKQEAEKDKIVTESLLSVASMVASGQVDRETAINILIHSQGLTREEAQMIVPAPQNINANANANANTNANE